MTVTAIVQRYYRERDPYIVPILRSLASQTYPPVRVILWNNAINKQTEFAEEWPFKLHVIYSQHNTLMGRWAAVLLAETEYVYIQDDDLLMGPATIERLLAVSRQHFGTLVGPFGMNFGSDPEKPYTSGRRIHEGPADVLLGRCLLASKAHFLKRLAMAAVEPMGRCDDIKVSTAPPAMNYAVPGIRFTNLDERGVGLSHEPEHFDERNTAARAVCGVSR